MDKRYNIFSKYLKEKYGQKVYKLPVNLPLSCPNRDGNIATGGCTFCGDVATGFESLENDIDIKKQLMINKKHIGERYNADKFIAYFQNFTNTYLDLNRFEQYVNQACIEDVVELSISTRPDCINDDYLDVLDKISKKNNVNISIELGLQSINHKTLKKINRGHTLAEFIDSVLRIKKYGFEICVHLIANLPWDEKSDFIEAAKVISALDLKQIKIHSLYILKNTTMGEQYLNNEFQLISKEEYVDRVVDFIRYSKSDIVFQRLLARAPKEETLFCNWSTSWWKIQDMIDEKLEALDAYQGDRCDYLNGKALGGFNE